MRGSFFLCYCFLLTTPSSVAYAHIEDCNTASQGIIIGAFLLLSLLFWIYVVHGNRKSHISLETLLRIAKAPNKTNNYTIPLKLILVILTSNYAIAWEPYGSYPIALPGCMSNCGAVDIYYPFGIGRNCSFDESFQVTCNQTKQGDFIPYLHNRHLIKRNSNSIPYYYDYEYELLEIPYYYYPSQVVVNFNVAMQCSPNNDKQEITIELTGTQFRVSNALNKFISMGCGKLAVAYSTESQVACFSMGCANISDTPTDTCNGLGGCNIADTPTDTCNGLGGCCQTALPVGISSATLSFGDVVIFDESNVTFTFTSRCNYAAIVANGYFQMNKSYLSTQMDGLMMPVVLDWSIPERNRCSSNGRFFPSANSPGYICQCFDGFEGNPYLPDGCQDINECLQYGGCPNRRKCRNTYGSFYCSCPLGMRPHPSNPVEACQLNRATFAGFIIAFGIIMGVVVYILFRAATVLKKKYDLRRVNEKRQKNSTRHIEIISQLQNSSNQDVTGRMTILGVEELEKATNKFDEALIVGRGGHGIVYKGILSNQQVIAIKRPKIKDDDKEIEEFLNEVLILSQLNHRNVVKLVGCCLEDEIPLLVYEFISNGTLTDRLHVEEGTQSLSWVDRLRIALETARALCYLHSAASISVFHRDIKTSNILLTDGLTVKLSDFGASRSVQIDATGVTTIVQGTYGYLDPEYYYTGRLTEKSDVYSFGVILAELLIRKKPYSFVGMPNGGSLVAFFSSAMSESRLPEILDPQILEEEHLSELESVSQVAEMCMKLKGEERPTMKEVEMRLEILWRSKIRIAEHWNTRQVVQQQPLLEEDQSRAYSQEVELIESANFPR